MHYRVLIYEGRLDGILFISAGCVGKVTNDSKGTFSLYLEAERIAPIVKPTLRIGIIFCVAVTRGANARRRLSAEDEINFMTSRSKKKSKIDRSPKSLSSPLIHM